MALVILPLLLAVVAQPATSPINIDIHLRVLADAYDRVLAANEYLNEKLSSNAVDFQTADTPHITLFVLWWRLWRVASACSVFCAWSCWRHALATLPGSAPASEAAGSHCFCLLDVLDVLLLAA
jgi:hypothetical protein